ncbi:hypothetical protein SDC9_56891 [bioreactor metagenome]|uniref:Dienelactone hydrolase domain-containing protein n=1 Tax=bioreactor metagenome TaxID=1076179 RepID=A0A644X3A4_9ZZZZ|nr:hypothetical protein [Paludibacter sp.]
MKNKIIYLFFLLLISSVIHAQDTEPYISIRSNKKIGETLSLSMKASNATNEQLIWIDLNGNGQKDDGEQVTSFGVSTPYVKNADEIRIYGPVWTFSVAYQQLTHLELSPNHPNLNQMWCSYNSIGEIDLSDNLNLSYLSCQSNDLKRLVFNPGSKIKTISCRENELGSDAVTELINSLPTKNQGDGAEIIAVDIAAKSERNIVNREHVNLANAKNWALINYNKGVPEPYNPTDITKEVLREGLYTYFGWGKTYPQNNITDQEVTILSKTQTEAYEYWHIKYLVDVVGDVKEYSYGYLLLPANRGSKPLPLVLALHPTGAGLGKDRVMGIYESEAVDVAEEKKRIASQYAHELGLKGDFIVFAPDRAGYGERRLLDESIDYSEQMTEYQNYLRTFRPGWRLTSGKNVWDIQRALDFLLEYDFVDRGKVGAIGYSLGAADALMSIACDDRIKTAVVNSGSNLHYREDLWNQDQTLRSFLSNASSQNLGEIVNLMVMLTAGKSMVYLWSTADPYDAGGPHFLEGFRNIYNVINLKWRQYGVTDLSLYMHSQGHDFPAEARAHAYQWLKDKLYGSGLVDPSTVED